MADLANVAREAILKCDLVGVDFQEDEELSALRCGRYEPGRAQGGGVRLMQAGVVLLGGGSVALK